MPRPAISEHGRSNKPVSVPAALVEAVRNSRPEFKYASNAEIVRQGLTLLLGNPSRQDATSKT